MLLIQADLIKAVWFVIFPIYTYTRGPVASHSAFCQASGFFFAVGIECSDVAVLLIALHSAMYIWRPQSGLYPYRWVAYTAYVLVPLLLASLAFLDGGYHNVGYFCYLTNGQGRASMAFSWVPRYTLFTIIIVTYLCIYVYVRRRILNYEHSASSAHPTQPSERRLTVLPPTDPCERNLSLCSTLRPPASRGKDRLRSVYLRNVLSRGRAEATPTTGSIPWNLPRFAEEACSSVHAPYEQDRRLSSTTRIPDHPSPTLAPPCRAYTAKPGWSLVSSTSAETWPELAAPSPVIRPLTASAGATRPSSSSATIPAVCPAWRRVLLGGSSTPSSAAAINTTTSAPPTPVAQLEPHISHDALASQASRNRDKIRRQLRSLLVYPLLYLVIWTFPMVNHAAGYAAPQPADRPAWMLALSLASMAVQGAADSAVFTAREKPWRYAGRDGFWGSVRRSSRDWWGWGSGARGAESSGVGLSREEMLVEVRLARARRRKEIADEVEEKRKGRVAAAGGRRNWWEFMDVDDGYA